MLIKLLILYLLIINAAGLLLMLVDKYKAKKNLWRIPENILFLFAFLWGSLGTTLGMKFFRHKTKHWYFRYGFPAILILEIAGVLWLVWYFMIR